MDQPLSDFIKGYSKFLCNFLRILGLWKPFDKSKLQIVIYSMYAVIFLSAFIVVYISFMVLNIFFLTDFKDFSNRIYISLTGLALAIKVINFFMENNDWQNVYTGIKEFRVKSNTERQTVEGRAHIIQRINYFYYFLSNSYAILIALVTIYQGATKLMYSARYPGIDWQNNRQNYWIIFVYQLLGIFISANADITIDSYYCFMMIMISAQANILGSRLAAIQMKGSVSHIRKKLIQQIQTHWQINANLELIEKNLQWAYFCQLLFSSVVISATTIEVTMVK